MFLFKGKFRKEILTYYYQNINPPAMPWVAKSSYNALVFDLNVLLNIVLFKSSKLVNISKEVYI